MTENDKNKIIKLEQLKTFKDLQSSEVSKFSLITGLVGLSAVSTMNLTTSEEWKVLCTDNEDKILFGIQQDGTLKIYADMDEILDCILASYKEDTSTSSTDSTT